MYRQSMAYLSKLKFFGLILFQLAWLSLHEAVPITGDSVEKKECSYNLPKIDVKRIVGGQVPRRYEYPMMAALIQKNNFNYVHPEGRMDPLFCGGSLITDCDIMTAAHCISGVSPESIMVSLGDFNLENSTSAIHNVSAVIRHPNFTSQFDNDIAIVKLSKAVVFSDRAVPSMLPPPEVELPIGGTVMVSGWGRTSYRGFKSGKLRHVQLYVYNNTVCSKSLSLPFSDNMICAGDIDGGHDACQGDSGGPMTIQSDGKKIVMGIVSYGRGCGFRGLAAAYTKVSHYIDWIHSVTGDSGCRAATQKRSDFYKKR